MHLAALGGGAADGVRGHLPRLVLVVLAGGRPSGAGMGSPSLRASLCFLGFGSGHARSAVALASRALLPSFRSLILLAPPGGCTLKATGRMKKKIFCTIPQDLIKDPLLYTLGNRFNVVPNIRGASVTDEIALLSLELEGEDQDVHNAVDFLMESGVKVEELRDSDDED
ncbi:MAG: hypothetical protein DWQ01_08400 [Planctomycetota bacterium]|nr:MAG: hypothetical protein DWQ01_08400 [Planctomycetota bacterium]